METDTQQKNAKTKKTTVLCIMSTAGTCSL